MKLARQLYRNAQNQKLNKVYISFIKFSRGWSFSDKKIAISEILNSFIKMSDMALNKIFKKRDFNFFKELNSKKFEISN